MPRYIPFGRRLRRAAIHRDAPRPAGRPRVIGTDRSSPRMFPAPRRRGVTRLAAGSVLAATALASGGFAALGATAAHADGTPGTYTNPTATSWATDGSTDATFTSVDVTDPISS